MIVNFLKIHYKKLIILLILLAILIWQLLLTPSHIANWRAENEFLPTFSLDEKTNILTVTNFRDFHRTETEENIKNWRTETFNMNEIEGMDFIISHFHDYHGIAHSFVTFRFNNGNNLTISMEARLEEEEEYSPFNGIMNQFEMMYLVGSERDFIGSRVGHRNEEVYLYETTADKEISQKILKYFMADINKLEKNPRFYNTIWRNCTTEVVTQVESAIDKKIWWTWEHLLPGYADEKALEMNFLKNQNNLEFTKYQEKHNISAKHIPEWDYNFSENIRR